jgi:hypothetical protein
MVIYIQFPQTLFHETISTNPTNSTDIINSTAYRQCSVEFVEFGGVWNPFCTMSPSGDLLADHMID